MDLQQAIRSAINLEMRLKGFTQEKLSQLTGIDSTAISRILSGKSRLNLENAPILCSALGLDFSEVVAGIYQVGSDSSDNAAERLTQRLSKRGAGTMAAAKLQELQTSINRILKDAKKDCLELVDAQAVVIRVEGDPIPLLVVGEWNDGETHTCHTEGGIEACAQGAIDERWWRPLLFNLRELARLITLRP